MARPRGKSHGRRAEMLETAARIFHTKGFEAATIQHIADEMGLLKGSLYYYMANKEEVLYEIIRSYHEETRAYFDEIVALDVPTIDKLRRFIETETAHTAHHRVKSSLFFTEWRSLSEERRRSIIVERDRHDDFVRDCIVDAQAAGDFRPEINPRVAANGILGMVNSVYQWYDPDGPQTAEEIGREFADLIIDGLTVKGRATAKRRQPGKRAS